MGPESSKRFEQTLTTARLELRPIAAADTARLHELWTSPGVRRYLWDNEIIAPTRTGEAIGLSQRLFAEGSGGLWGAWLARRSFRRPSMSARSAARASMLSCPPPAGGRLDGRNLDSLSRDSGPSRLLGEMSGLAGFGGLWPFREPAEFELVYGVAEPLWGQGYAGEIAQAVLAQCFDVLGMPVVRASTDAPNIASIRVLEKLGFSLVRRASVGSLDTVFYSLQRRVPIRC